LDHRPVEHAGLWRPASSPLAASKEETMVKTIGNPLSWGIQALWGTGHVIGDAADGLASHDANPPQVRDLRLADIRMALRKGARDFADSRSDVFFLVLIYPIIGALLFVIALHRGLLPVLFPMAAGFALLGPLAGIGLYDMSRRREAGEDASWGAVLAGMRSRVLGPELVLGAYLLGIFALWMYAANTIYQLTLGPDVPTSLSAFATDVLTTPAGWAMIVIGCGIGFLFAVVVLVISLTSFPMLIDRPVGLPVAVATSYQVARRNPVVVAAWGLVVAVSLAVASLPLFLGLIIVMPILGHATWHLYRAAVH
jgi:uncharacterized membrane protein